MTEPTKIAALLRRHDPAPPGSEPGTLEVAEVQRAMLRAATSAPAATGFVPGWAAALALAVLGAIAVARLSLAPAEPGPVASVASVATVARSPLPARSPGAVAEPAVATALRRQIHLVTRRGTRVLWILDPDFTP